MPIDLILFSLRFTQYFNIVLDFYTSLLDMHMSVRGACSYNPNYTYTYAYSHYVLLFAAAITQLGSINYLVNAVSFFYNCISILNSTESLYSMCLCIFE